jgi:hypothetical protein
VKSMPQGAHLVFLNGAMTARAIAKPDKPIEPAEMTTGQTTLPRQARTAGIADEFVRCALQR